MNLALTRPPEPWRRQVVGILCRLARQRPDRPAIIDEQRTTTFRALYAAATARAQTFEARATRGAVALLAGNRSDFLVEMLAALCADYSPITVPDSTDDRATEAAVRAVLQARASGCRPWKAVFTIDTGRGRLLLTHGESPSAPRKARALGMLPGGRALIASPLHLTGPLEFALRQLLLGGTVVLLDRFTAARWRTAAREHRPDWGFVTPAQLQQVCDSGDEERLRDDVSSLRLLVHSSAPCPPPLRLQVTRFLAPHRVAEYYGTGLYDGTLTHYHQTAQGGIPLPGADLRVVDDHGRPQPVGTEGLIQGHSRAGLITHFADEPCPGPDAWHGCGDRGRLTSTGALTITDVEVPGRAIVSGVKVALADTHAVLVAHPAITAATVTAQPHPRTGHLLHAHVTTSAPTLTATELRAWCAQRLTPAQRPRRWQITSITDPDHPDSPRDAHARL